MFRSIKYALAFTVTGQVGIAAILISYFHEQIATIKSGKPDINVPKYDRQTLNKALKQAW